MLQGNLCYRLVASTNYRPGGTGATAGPTNRDAGITLVYVAPGAATLDYYDTRDNRNVITIGAGNTGTLLPISLSATGSSLSGSIFGFSQGAIYGNS